MKTREYRIDNLRSLAILLVVFGHSIIIYSSSWNLYTSIHHMPILDKIKDIINLIQMPIFMSLSGYLFVSALRKKQTSQIIKDKAKRLLVPYIFFAFLWLLPIRYMISYPKYDMPLYKVILKCIIYGSDNGHLWYLITLFWNFVIGSLLYSLFSKKLVKDQTEDYKIILCVFIISFFMHITSIMFDLYYFELPFHYFYYMMLGSTIRVYEKRLIDYIDKYIDKYVILLVVLSLFFIAGYYFFDSGKKQMIFALFASSILVVLLFVIIPNKKNVVLFKISELSFGIYLFHSPLVYFTYAYIPNSSPIIVVLLNFVVFGSVSALLTMIVKGCKFRFIIGE